MKPTGKIFSFPPEPLRGKADRTELGPWFNYVYAPGNHCHIQLTGWMPLLGNTILVRLELWDLDSI
jgi:hypothetical protein